MPPADFVLLPRDLPWERAYDREDANAPQIAKLRLTLPADYPAGTVLKLPMPCLCGEHTSRFTKMKAGFEGGDATAATAAFNSYDEYKEEEERRLREEEAERAEEERRRREEFKSKQSMFASS